MSTIMTRIVSLALVLVLAQSAVWAQENQIVNGEFDDALNGWGRYGATGYDLEVVQDAGLSGTNAVLFDITDASAAASIGIAQSLTTGLVQGEHYPVGFTARAGQEREMILLAQLYKPEGPSWVDIWTQTVELKQIPQTFVFDYEHTGETTTTNPDWEVDVYYMLKGQWWPMSGSDLNTKVWLDRVYFGAEPPLPRRDLATNPDPADEASDVWRDTDLGWTPGAFAQTHDVYLGADFNDVNDAARATPMGVLVNQGQSISTYDPGRLAFDQTYYWRVDEVNGAPDNAVIKGTVWSFTTEPLAYPIENVTATSNATSNAGEGPVNAVNGSGLDDGDLHSTSTPDMWQGTPGADPVYIQFEFDRIYKLHEMLVWNYNAEFEPILGFGLKDVTVEYSVDGTEWTLLGDVELAQATAGDDYAANSTVDFSGAAVRYVRLTVNSGWGMLGQYGLSEVRFLYIPVQARGPEPADGAAEVDINTSLAWRPGRDAANHAVSISTDEGAVAEGTAPVEVANQSSYVPGDLGFGDTYYWRVDEVNDVEAVNVWEGDLWSFATQEYAVIEDFEAYNDEDDLIYETWIDGWVNETGSTVGYLDAPFAEISIVHGGAQSMPLEYNNAQSPFYSETSRTWASNQNWTVGGANSLRLHFQGGADNTPETLYLVVEDSAGNVAVLTNADPEAVLATDWQEWVIPFADLTAAGVNPAGVKTMYVGLGDRDNPISGGTGRIYLDDIEFGKPLI
jgi:F5/8 type C domain/Carbohydrate binding domain